MAEGASGGRGYYQGPLDGVRQRGGGSRSAGQAGRRPLALLKNLREMIERLFARHPNDIRKPSRP